MVINNKSKARINRIEWQVTFNKIYKNQEIVHENWNQIKTLLEKV